MSKLSGVSAHTLRAWEKRYSAIRPSRTSGGQRCYTMDDLERLRRLKRLTELGYSIGQVARLGDEELTRLLKGPETTVVQDLPGTFIPNTKSVLQVEKGAIDGIINDLAEFRLDEVYRNLTAARMRYTPRDFVLLVALPLLKEIGVLVSSGSFSVSQEHAFSALLRDQLSHLTNPSRTTNAKEAIAFVAPEGDMHEFGLILSQILALNYGIKTHYLGSNMPLDGLILAIRALRIEHIVISLADLPEGALSVPFSNYIKMLRSSLPKHVTIFMAGRGISHEMKEELKDVAVFVPTLEEMDNIFKRIASFSA